ncbi:tryptophan halogenase family protein [Altererythrobacter sp. ZODW24]|uniref:tryptophan halogenase family protein n=1 Tax=Altererythrobacter sp. ZODW24 TaxID=2185142 RepID=UPI0023DD2806|nr:tryptophan halogenase family protein [Altererythrobacter sp. ZODW24]
MPETPSSSILIVGGGTAGWMAAAALSRFTDRAITLVESEAIGTVGVGEATIPQIHLFNAALGIDEGEFLRETRGSFKLGIEFPGWAGEGETYMHAFGPVGHGQGLLPFHQYWLRAKAEGLVSGTAPYSLNERAARALRMQRGEAGSLPYAYHFDAGLYAAYLRKYAEARGVTRTEGIVASVEQNGENGDITSGTLEDGDVLTADFFIDCTGFRALLVEGALETGFEDWTHWLPCDRAMAVPCSASGDFTPYTQSIAREAGWQWRIPLQHRIGNGYVYCSEFLSDDDAADALIKNIEGQPDGDPRPLRFTTGKRKQHWTHNCLALGLAAGFMEPLESTSIHLIQSAISRFMLMLPDGRGNPAVVAEFNRQADFEWERIRDFLILHYWANGREGQPFWDRCRAMELPDTLTAKIEQWQAAGFIHREHEELFTEVGWFQVLAGQGVETKGWNPMANAMPSAELTAMLSKIEQGNERAIAAMPGHTEALRSACLAAAPQRISA